MVGAIETGDVGFMRGVGWEKGIRAMMMGAKYVMYPPSQHSKICQVYIMMDGSEVYTRAHRRRFAIIWYE